MIAIAQCHRQLAKITYMSTDRDGNLIIGPVELRIVMQLLRQNLAFVQEVDGLKELGFAAYVSGDMKWVREVCDKLDEVELQYC